MLWPQLRALGRAAPRAALHFPRGLPSLSADSVVETLGVFWRPSRMGIDRFPHLVSACFKLSNFMLRYKEAEREQDRCDEEPFRAEDGSERSFDDVRAFAIVTDKEGVDSNTILSHWHGLTTAAASAEALADRVDLMLDAWEVEEESLK